MIQISPNSNRKPARGATFSATTRQAILEGVGRGDPVAELEYLGLGTRYINLLENCDREILSLEQLVQLRPDELLEIPNFGQSGLHELMTALMRYDQLEESKRAMSIQPTVRPK